MTTLSLFQQYELRKNKFEPGTIWRDKSSHTIKRLQISHTQLNTVMDLIAENGYIDILENIRIFLQEEYEINYVPFFEKTNDLSI
jgi:hypothetical protein